MCNGCGLGYGNNGDIIQALRRGPSESSPAVHRDLSAYATVPARESEQPIADPSKLVAPMLVRLMAVDRAFGKARRMNQTA